MTSRVRVVLADANVLINLMHVARLSLCGDLPGLVPRGGAEHGGVVSLRRAMPYPASGPNPSSPSPRRGRASGHLGFLAPEQGSPDFDVRAKPPRP